MGKHESLLVDVHGNPISMNAFTAGDRSSRELASWTPKLKSADATILPNKPTMEGRSYDLARNNGFAAGAVRSQKDRIIGHQYRLSLRPSSKVLGIDVDVLTEWATMVEQVFHLWADDTEAWIDAQRRRTFVDILREGVGIEMMSGEYFLAREWRPQNPTPFATCFSVVEPERISTPKGMKDSNKLRAGVELDLYGAAKSYFVRTTHPLDGAGCGGRAGGGSAEWTRITKRNRFGWIQMIHLFESERANQTRGFTRFASIIQKMKMLDRQEDVELEASILAATYAMVIESDMAPSSAYDALGATDDDENGFLDFMGDYLGAKEDFKNGANIRFDGAKIPHLFPGEELKMVSPNHPNKAFEAFESAMLRHIARGLGLSYEQLSGDYTKTTYSSARTSMMEAWNFVLSKRTSFASKLATNIFRLWMDEAVSRGIVALPGSMTVEDYFANRSAWTNCSWIGQGRGNVDEVKAARANDINLANGSTTLQKVAAENGEDWEQVLEQRARELKKMEELGIPVPENYTGDSDLLLADINSNPDEAG